MEIYNEQMEPIENPDLTLGWMEHSTRTMHHAAVEAVPDVWHYEVIAEYPNGGKDVARVVDTPGIEAREAWDEEIPIQIYHPYTEEELAQRKEEENKPNMESRLASLEEENQQLKEALELLLSGETGEGMTENA